MPNSQLSACRLFSAQNHPTGRFRQFLVTGRISIAFGSGYRPHFVRLVSDYVNEFEHLLDSPMPSLEHDHELIQPRLRAFYGMSPPRVASPRVPNLDHRLTPLQSHLPSFPSVTNCPANGLGLCASLRCAVQNNLDFGRAYCAILDLPTFGQVLITKVCGIKHATTKSGEYGGDVRTTLDGARDDAIEKPTHRNTHASPGGSRLPM